MSIWHELVVEGTEATLRAFVAGFAAGRRTSHAGVFGRECELEHESLGERVKALFAGGSHHVFLAPRELAVPLADALGEHGDAVGLRLERRREVAALGFDFTVEAFSRPVATEIRADLIRNPPTGVRIENLEEHEEENPDARGTELYAPVHAYIYRASGRFVGRPTGILDVRRRSSQRDFVRIGGLRIEAKSN